MAIESLLETAPWSRSTTLWCSTTGKDPVALIYSTGKGSGYKMFPRILWLTHTCDNANKFKEEPGIWFLLTTIYKLSFKFMLYPSGIWDLARMGAVKLIIVNTKGNSMRLLKNVLWILCLLMAYLQGVFQEHFSCVRSPSSLSTVDWFLMLSPQIKIKQTKPPMELFKFPSTWSLSVANWLSLA